MKEVGIVLLVVLAGVAATGFRKCRVCENFVTGASRFETEDGRFFGHECSICKDKRLSYDPSKNWRLDW